MNLIEYHARLCQSLNRLACPDMCKRQAISLVEEQIREITKIFQLVVKLQGCELGGLRGIGASWEGCLSVWGAEVILDGSWRGCVRRREGSNGLQHKAR